MEGGKLGLSDGTELESDPRVSALVVMEDEPDGNKLGTSDCTLEMIRPGIGDGGARAAILGAAIRLSDGAILGDKLGKSDGTLLGTIGGVRGALCIDSDVWGDVSLYGFVTLVVTVGSIVA